MPDPKDPQGSTPEPTQQPPRAEQPTTPLPATGTSPQPTAEQPSPAAEAAAPEAGPTPESAAQPTAEPTTTASAAEAPPGPTGPPPAAGPVYATAPRRRFRQVAAHRATQLVAVGVLGLIIGGGLVALLDRDGYRGGGHGRPGISRMDDRGAPGGPGTRGERCPGPGWENHGRFER